MNNYDWLIDFHKKSHINHPSGKKGYEAVRYLISIIQTNKINLKSPHNLINHLIASYELNYKWLITFAKKIQLLEKIKGSNALFKRFGNQEEYRKVIYEIETALKFKSGGYSVEFIQKSNQRTPDLLITKDLNRFNVEVTSLDPPRDLKVANEFFFSLQNICFQNRVMIGGTIVSFQLAKKKKAYLDSILKELEGKIKESKESVKLIEYNIPGLINVFLASQEYDGEPSLLNNFDFVYKDEKHIISRIYEKIVKKISQLDINSNPGLIVIYADLDDKDLKALYENYSERILGYLKTYPKLIGLILSTFRVFTESSEDITVKKTNENLLITLSPNIQEREKTIIWKNPTNNDKINFETIYYKFHSDFLRD
ncbi:MAG: hypothetical protein HeimC3_32090 [Candidatus Heimdallarchaeota archaeon LC_3]|nr:MAG: hypothetical protein HeimC3_32090 [Candidatus Heimdallarchaeota archaeon LC_3]